MDEKRLDIILDILHDAVVSACAKYPPPSSPISAWETLTTYTTKLHRAIRADEVALTAGAYSSSLLAIAVLAVRWLDQRRELSPSDPELSHDMDKSNDTNANQN
jgi:hypothetical protein